MIWLGEREDTQLLPILRQKGYTIQFFDDATQCEALRPLTDCLICCTPETEMGIKDFPAGLPVVLYEPRGFTHDMCGPDTRFASVTELARQAEAVVCCDEASRQWWSCFNSNVHLLNEPQITAEPSAFDVGLAEMIVDDYLAGCSYAERHKTRLWGKIKGYYKEFGLRQTLHRVYEKLTGSGD